RRIERAARAVRLTATRQHAPGLRDRIDPAFVVLCRAERGAVVEVGAPVPLAIPRLVQRGRQQIGFVPPARGTVVIAALLDQPGEALEHGPQEPAEPDAL